MKRRCCVCLLVFGFILSCTLVYAADFYVVPTKKKNYAPVEKTGQTPTVPFPAPTGSDGDLQKGVDWPDPRFTDNNNGTVTDNLTGLIWLKMANCAGVGVKVDWDTAIDYCAALYDGCTPCFGNQGDCGLTDGSSAGDWRLPNIKELLSLLDFAYFDPALSDTAGTAKCSEGNPFNGVQWDDSYWSSTTYASSSSVAYRLRFSNGTSDAVMKNIVAGYVWCVRGGN